MSIASSARWIRFVLSLLVFSTLGTLTRAAEKPWLLMISVDGMRADYLTEADRHNSQIPTLRRLMAEGTFARRTMGVFPTVTYPSHTSLITGNPPARHGIYMNELFEPLSTSKNPWHYYAKQIKCPTLIDAFADAKRKTAGVSWPVCVGARLDWNLPEIWDANDFEGTFAEMSRSNSTPGMISCAEKEFGFTFANDHVDVYRSAIARYILRHEKPDLLLIHFEEMDKTQHSKGPLSAEAFKVLENTDRHIAEVLEECQESGRASQMIICIVSDHGFAKVEREFRPNAVLRDAGLIDYNAAKKTIRSWKVKAWTTGAAAAIMLADPNDQASLAKARGALAPYIGKTDSPIARLIEPAELKKRGSNPRAAFMFDLTGDWTFSSSTAGEPIGKAKVKGMHGELPERPELAASFLISGPGIAKGRVIDTMRMIDIAPTLAKVCGVKLKGAEGKAVALGK